MTFALPPFDDLSADEDEILALPVSESAIVVGGPGSGKTVMALYRAQWLHALGHPTLLLMFNRLLSSYTKAAVADLGISSVVETYHSWFPRFWQRQYGSQPPRIDRWTFDWAECKRIILSNPLPDGDRHHVIVDEGQDLPPAFYLVLRLISRSTLVFADENQRITDHQSTIAEIRANSGVQRRLSLSGNRRNSRGIAEFASRFDVSGDGQPLGPFQDAGSATTAEAKARPKLVAHARLHEAISYVADYERAHPDEKIGVLLPLTASVRQFYNRLSGRTANPVQLYVNRSERRPGDRVVDLASPGMKLVTWASCKGLQFDSVFLPELQSLSGDPEGDDLRMKLYVACTRARRSLTLMYTGEGEPTLIRHLPVHLLDDERSQRS